MIEPLTKDKVLRHPILYREAPNIRETDLRMALGGLKQDIRGITDVSGEVRDLLLYHVDTWFPTFMEK